MECTRPMYSWVLCGTILFLNFVRLGVSRSAKIGIASPSTSSFYTTQRGTRFSETASCRRALAGCSQWLYLSLVLKPSIQEMASSSDVVKLEMFDGANFKRWQAKTKLWLNDLRLFWVMSNPPMFPLETAEMTRWEDANNSALARLLAVLSNWLFDVYVTFTNAKQLWDESDEKYFEGDNGNESFITAAYLNYKIVDGRSVMEQLYELQLHVRDLNQYDCLLPESFHVNVILAKLPPSWRNFVTTRRHIKEHLTVNELSATINVEERARASDSRGKAQVQAHQVEVKSVGGSGN